MRHLHLSTWLSALCIAASTHAAGPGTMWDAELREKMAATDSVLLDRDNPGGPPSYYVSAPRDRILAAPSWDSDTEPPPLSLEKAIALAREELQQRNPHLASFRFMNAGLGPIPSQDNGQAKWWYRLLFRGSSASYRDRTFLVPVLMDGTFLQPHLYPESTMSFQHEMIMTQTVERLTEEMSEPNLLIKERLSTIILPEVDFRQANIVDIAEFFDLTIPEYGTGVETNDATRLRVRIHESALSCKNLPYAWPESPPLPTFAAKDISLLDALNIIIEISQLKMVQEGNTIILFNPKY